MANIAKKKSAIIETYRCAKCGEDFERKDFYKANGGVYAEEGYLPVCKDCFKRIYMEFLAIYLDEEKAAKRICMTFDLYYSRAIFDTCDAYGQEAVIGNYIKRLNMNNNKGKSMKDSLEEGFSFLSDKEIEERRERVERENAAKYRKYDDDDEEDEDEKQPSRRDIKKWGSGFDYSDYQILNAHEEMLRKANPNLDSNQEVFIIDLCHTHMLKMKALREGRVDDYNKLSESYRKTFKQAELKTTQEGVKTADDCWSTFCSVVSQHTPEEYYRNKERYKDHDGFDEYRRRFVDRPIDNLMNCTQERDSEFYVHDVDDDEEDMDD